MRRRVWRGDYKTVLIHVVKKREIVALPITVGTGAVNAKNEGDLLAWLEIARIVKEVGATRLHLDYRTLIDHAIRRAVGRRAVQDRGLGARRTRDLDKWLLLGAGISEEPCHG